MNLSKHVRGTVLENRRFLWSASIISAIAAIVFPVLVLAVFGHFKITTAPNETPSSLGTVDVEDDKTIGNGSIPAVALPSPTLPPGEFVQPEDVGITPPVVGSATTPPAPATVLFPIQVDADVQSPLPSVSPSWLPSSLPSLLPSTTDPSALPSQFPTTIAPTRAPTPQPTGAPTVLPTKSPTVPPTRAPTTEPPTDPPILITYRPGFLTVNDDENGLVLSAGLEARMIAKTGQFVKYANGQSSSIRFHIRPDFGATFPDTNPSNEGGWIYVSNSEAKTRGDGGVGAIVFDRNGNVLNYKMVLRGTTMNCGGGRTPWNTWVSCEEWGSRGQAYQVDPSGARSQKTVLGGTGGRFESFSFDVRNRSTPRFFVTEDLARGALRRFTPSPSSVDWNNPWTMLHGNGTMEYLVLEPSSVSQGTGRFKWVSSLGTARSNAQRFYPDSEGIDVSGSQLFFVCKKIKQLFVLDLDAMTYTKQSSRSGLFDGGPDQMARIVGKDRDDILYFTEEGGRDAGIHGRDEFGNFYTILEGPKYRDETTGLAFDPSGRHMYVAYQENGILFDITRRDGLPFYGTTLNVKYHAQGQG